MKVTDNSIESRHRRVDGFLKVPDLELILYEAKIGQGCLQVVIKGRRR